MPEFSEHDVEKVSRPPLVFDPAWVDPATDTAPGPATAWMMAVVGTPSDGDVAVFDADLGYCVWQAGSAAATPIYVSDGMGGADAIYDSSGNALYVRD